MLFTKAFVGLFFIIVSQVFNFVSLFTSVFYLQSK